MSRRETVLLSIAATIGMYLLGWVLPLVAAFGDEKRARSAYIGLDVVLNVLTGGRAPELLSSRADRARTEGRRWGCVLCRLLDWIESNHCQDQRGKTWTSE